MIKELTNTEISQVNGGVLLTLAAIAAAYATGYGLGRYYSQPEEKESQEVTLPSGTSYT